MRGKSVLISGVGVAGPSLAYWLDRHGLIPTLVERAPALREGGYIIDFWGAAYDIAEQMGVLPELLRAGYRVREVRIVDERGHRKGGFDAALFREAAFGRYTTIARGDLGAILFRAIDTRVETLFGDSITGLEDGVDGVLVHFEHAPPRRFDLVVGADGLHSTVRSLAFGPEAQFEKFLGQTVVAFQVAGYPHRDEDVYVAYSAPGRQIARFALRGDSTLFLCVFAEETRVPAPGATRQPGARTCAPGCPVSAGSARRSSRRSIVPRSCTSIALARSGWIAGRKDTWRWSGTRRTRRRCWPAKDSRWRSSAPTCWPASWGAPIGSTRRSPGRGAAAAFHPAQTGRGGGLRWFVRPQDPFRQFLPQSGHQAVQGPPPGKAGVQPKPGRSYPAPALRVG